MGFDEDPKDEIESYPCIYCDAGKVEYDDEKKQWECDSCETTAYHNQRH